MVTRYYESLDSVTKNISSRFRAETRITSHPVQIPFCPPVLLVLRLHQRSLVLKILIVHITERPIRRHISMMVVVAVLFLDDLLLILKKVFEMHEIFLVSKILFVGFLPPLPVALESFDLVHRAKVGFKLFQVAMLFAVGVFQLLEKGFSLDANAE